MCDVNFNRINSRENLEKTNANLQSGVVVMEGMSLLLLQIHLVHGVPQELHPMKEINVLLFSGFISVHLFSSPGFCSRLVPRPSQTTSLAL